jgi:RNA polymerase sigma-70 factor (sigma-E family)
MIPGTDPVVGEEVAVTYEEFADSRLPALLRYAVMLTGDPNTAQDLVQETMLRAQLHWGRVVRSGTPDGYVRKILTNLFIDMRRGSWWRRVRLFADPDPGVPAVTDHAHESAERDRIWHLLAGLSPRQRAALVLRYYEDLPDQEIADALGCAVGTVRSAISRGLEALRTEVVETR